MLRKKFIPFLSLTLAFTLLTGCGSTGTGIGTEAKKEDSAPKETIGLTMRARVIVYAKDRVKPSELSTYADLTNPKWKGKILVRSSSNIYNQSLLASFIELEGEEKAKQWAAGIVKNMARTPKGNDRDQVKAIAAGIGDIALVNTYYIGKMLTSSDPEEVKAARQVGIFFPDQGFFSERTQRYNSGHFRRKR